MSNETENDLNKVKIREQIGVLLVVMTLLIAGFIIYRGNKVPEVKFTQKESVNTNEAVDATKAEPVKTKIININTASLEELDTLPGVGPATAQKIIDYRNTNGAFKTKEGIMDVSGIGDAKYSQIKDKIGI